MGREGASKAAARGRGQTLENFSCNSLIPIAQTMRQLQTANVHRNVVKPSKSSGHVTAAASVAPPRSSHGATGVTSADNVPIEERLFHEADNRDAIRERARRCVSAYVSFLSWVVL